MSALCGQKRTRRFCASRSPGDRRRAALVSGEAEHKETISGCLGVLKEIRKFFLYRFISMSYRRVWWAQPANRGVSPRKNTLLSFAFRAYGRSFKGSGNPNSILLIETRARNRPQCALLYIVRVSHNYGVIWNLLTRHRDVTHRRCHKP